LLPGHSLAGFLLALLGAPLAVGAVAFATERLVLRRIGYDPEATIVATIRAAIPDSATGALSFRRRCPSGQRAFHLSHRVPWFGYSGYKLFVVAASGAVLLGVWVGAVAHPLRAHHARYAIRPRNSDGLRHSGGPGLFRRVRGRCAAIAAIAAVLLVPIQQAHYLMGLDPLLMSFIVVIIGGLGSLKGSVIAALVIGLLGGIVSVFFRPPLPRSSPPCSSP